MALALLVFPEPNDESGSARMLLRQVEADHTALAQFRDAFALSPFKGQATVTNENFENVQEQLAKLKWHLEKLSMLYHRYPRQIFKRVLQNKVLKDLWPGLCASVDRLSKQLDKTKKSNYSRFEIWRKLDDINIIYEDIVRELSNCQEITSRSGRSPTEPNHQLIS